MEATVVGGGLAGCEAAWQLARRGVRVRLVEQKPAAISPAHQTPMLAELVCSNSLRSNALETGPGLLKAELRRLGSLIIACADLYRVPAGDALAVERFGFGREITARLAMHPLITLERRPVLDVPPGHVILATGPLTGTELARRIRAACGSAGLYFYDAIAPIVDADSIDMDKAFRASRWGKGGGDDYVNCPMNREEYAAFVAAVQAGRKVLPHSFEEPRYFEGCLPIEVMAERGVDTLAFGPMKPIGLDDPRTGRWPHAVVQLRPENRYRTSYNLVGFQTRLAIPEQKRIFQMIPGLEKAEFLRFGAIHRNSYVDGPRVLGPELQLRTLPTVQLAGQITGVEGYIESCAMGLLSARFLAARLAGTTCPPPPVETAIGGLWSHVTRPRDDGERYEPQNINFGLLPPIEGLAAKKAGKSGRRKLHAERAQAALTPWLDQPGDDTLLASAGLAVRASA